MDIHDLVNAACDEMAKMDKDITGVVSWYVFEDKRVGTIQERFDADAFEHAAYTRLFRRGKP